MYRKLLASNFGKKDAFEINRIVERAQLRIERILTLQK